MCRPKAHRKWVFISFKGHDTKPNTLGLGEGVDGGGGEGKDWDKDGGGEGGYCPKSS